MGMVYCDREFDWFSEDEVDVIEDVQVHKRKPWHLLTGEVVEVVDGKVVVKGRKPVASLQEGDATDAADDDSDADSYGDS